MKKNVFASVIIAVICAGCVCFDVYGRDKVRNVITRTTDNSAAFSKLQVSGVADVKYIQSADGTTAVSIEGPHNIVDAMNVNVQDSTLKVGRDKLISASGDADVTIYVSTPALTDIHVSGSGDVSVGGLVEAGTFTIKVSGTGDLEIEELRCSRLEVVVNGSGDVEIERGAANTASYTVSGAGSLDARGVISRNVTAKVSGAGNLSCHASASIEARASGAGKIYYYGNPVDVSASTSGAGSIRVR